MLSLHAEDYQQEDYEEDDDSYYDSYVYKEDILKEPSDEIDNTTEDLDEKMDK